MVNVVYPNVYHKFLEVVNLINLNLGFTLSFSCVVETDFYQQLLLATIVPILVLAALTVTYAISRQRNGHSPEGLRDAKHKHLSIALFIMFIVYSSVSYTIFQTFVCETLDDSVSYLKADYSLVCDTDAHTAYEAYAALMILVYPIGIPAAFAWWLGSHRHQLVKVKPGAENLESLKPMASLWAAYKPHRYYYEVSES